MSTIRRPGGSEGGSRAVGWAELWDREEGSLRTQATSWEPHVPPHTLLGWGVVGMTAEEAEGIGSTGL